MDKSTDQMIEGLVSKLEPKRPIVAGAGIAVALAVFIIAIIAVSIVMTSHLRSDIASGDWSSELALGLFGAILASTATTFGAVRLFIPGRSIGPVPQVALTLGIIAMIWAVVGHGIPANQNGLAIGGIKCTVVLTAYSIIPAVVMLLGARRYAPTSLMMLGLFIATNAAAAGFGGLLLVCESDDLLHLALYHMAPAVVLSTAGALILKRFLRW